MPLKKNPHTRTDPLLASITPTIPLRFEPPENPAKATGHLADCGQSFRSCLTASVVALLVPTKHDQNKMTAEIKPVRIVISKPPESCVCLHEIAVGCVHDVGQAA